MLNWISMGKIGGGSCCFHDENTPSLKVSEEKQAYFCFGCKVKGDILNFIQEYHKVTFKEAIDELCKYTGVEITKVSIPKIIAQIRAFEPKSPENKEEKKRHYLKKDCMNNCENSIIKEWVKEGISPEVLKKHNVRYDKKVNSIVFPIHDQTGEIIALKYRTLEKDYKSKKIPKYIYSNAINKLDFFYWWHNNHKSALQKQEIILVEGEKSVMKLETWGFNNSVACMTAALADGQINLLLNSQIRDIVVAFDKDKDISFVKKQIRPLRNYKNIYIIWDTCDLLEEKDAPCDQGEEVWNTLYSERRRIVNW